MSGEQVYTTAPDGTQAYYLGQLGHVSGLVYSNTRPGGDEAMACTFEYNPKIQHQAISVGRRVSVVKGATVQWEGSLGNPVAGDGGWSISAEGSGTWGNRFRAIYTTSYTAENIIDLAIGRGLRWVRGTLTGGTSGATQSDSGAQNVTEFLNTITKVQSQLWTVTRVNAGIQVDRTSIPDAVSRIMVITAPAARTLAGHVNVLFARYQATADSTNVPATFGITSAINSNSVAVHDTLEDFWDLTGSGVMTSSSANALAVQALAKYRAVSYSDPFTVRHGQYLSIGGSPVDLACEKAGEVVQIMVADGPYGGELSIWPPIRFVAGKVEYNSDQDTLTVTPMQSWTDSLSDIMGLIAPKAPA